MKLKYLILTTLCSAVLAACGGAGDDSDDVGGSSSTSGSSATQAAALEACAAAKYPGSTADPQVYSFDAIAQFDSCAYKATGNTSYLTDGNNQCKVLAGLLASTQGTFKPLFCSGSSLKV